jgi:hypothetical protein
MNSRYMHRVQLLSTFLDLYLPKGTKSDQQVTSHWAYIGRLPSVDLDTPLVQLSVDTLCLAEIGSLYNDPGVLHEAQARYIRALPMLARELARPTAYQMRKDHVLATITILGLCELFDVIAQGAQGGKG